MWSVIRIFVYFGVIVSFLNYVASGDMLGIFQMVLTFIVAGFIGLVYLNKKL